VTGEIVPVLKQLYRTFQTIDWNKENIQNAIKEVAKQHDLKMGKIAMPLRVIVTGKATSPSIDSVLELLGRKETLKRLNNAASK